MRTTPTPPTISATPAPTPPTVAAAPAPTPGTTSAAPASTPPTTSAAPAPTPRTFSAAPADHFAHAVIGAVPVLFDTDGNGVEAVTLSGLSSHTHRFDGGVAGALVRTTWSVVGTGQVLGAGLSVRVVLPLGATVVRLEVVDSGGDADATTAVVTVVGSLASGAYCYYYGAGVALPLPVAVDAAPRPVFAAAVRAVAFGSAAAFPDGPHKAAAGWTARCIFFYTAPTDGVYRFSADFAGGAAMLSIDGGSVFAAATAGGAMTATGAVTLAAGMHAADLIYRTAADAPALTLRVGNTTVGGAAVRWDRVTVVPVITGLTPDTGGVAGGTAVTVTGVGFFTPAVEVLFDGRPAGGVVKVDATTLTAVAPPSPDGEAVATVTVRTGGRVEAEGGTSNGRRWAYAGTCPPVAFRQQVVAAAGGGGALRVAAPTSIALGPDGRVYLGLYGGTVQAFGLDGDFVAGDVCTSASVGAARSVLSLAFDPRLGHPPRQTAAAAADRGRHPPRPRPTPRRAAVPPRGGRRVPGPQGRQRAPPQGRAAAVD